MSAADMVEKEHWNEHWGVPQMFGCPGRCNHESGTPFVSVDWAKVKQHMVQCCPYIFSLHEATHLKQHECALGQPSCIVPGLGYEDYRRAREERASRYAASVAGPLSRPKEQGGGGGVVMGSFPQLLSSPQQQPTILFSTPAQPQGAGAGTSVTQLNVPSILQQPPPLQVPVPPQDSNQGGKKGEETPDSEEDYEEEEEVELPLDQEEEDRHKNERQQQHQAFASDERTGSEEQKEANGRQTTATATSPPRKSTTTKVKKKKKSTKKKAPSEGGGNSKKRPHESASAIYGCPQCLENQKNGKLGNGQKPFVTDRWLTLKRHLYFCKPELFKQHETLYIRDHLCLLPNAPPGCESFSTIEEHADKDFLENEKHRSENKRQRRLSRIREEAEPAVADPNGEHQQNEETEDADPHKQPSSSHPRQKSMLRRQVEKHKAEGRKRWTIHNHLLDGNQEPYMEVTNQYEYCNDANAALRKAIEKHFSDYPDPDGVQAAMGTGDQWVHWACRLAEYGERVGHLTEEHNKDKEAHASTLDKLGKRMQNGFQGSKEYVFSLHCIFQDAFIRCHLPRPPLLDLAFGMSLNATLSSGTGRDDFQRRMKAFRGYETRTFDIIALVLENPLDPNQVEDRSESLSPISPIDQRPTTYSKVPYHDHNKEKTSDGG